MPTLWIISILTLWVLVLLETGLLVLLLRGLGELRQQTQRSSTDLTSSSLEGGLNVGERAPTFIVTNQDGTLMHLDEFQGRKRILAFVLPDCSACVGAIDALNTIIQKEQDIIVLVVGGSDRSSNSVYAAEHHAQMPILAPTLSTIPWDVYHIPGVPFVFVLDELGIIRAKRIVNSFEHLQTLLATAFAPVSTTP